MYYWDAGDLIILWLSLIHLEMYTHTYTISDICSNVFADEIWVCFPKLLPMFDEEIGQTIRDTKKRPR